MKKKMAILLLLVSINCGTVTKASEMESEVGIEFSQTIKDKEKDSVVVIDSTKPKRLLPQTGEKRMASVIYSIIGLVLLLALFNRKKYSKRKFMFFLLGLVVVSQMQVDIYLAETSGSIGLKPNLEADTPIDPIDNKEIDSKKIPTSGPYSLSYVSDFYFGKHSIPTQEASYFAENDVVTIKETKEKKEIQNFIQISDTSGSTEGWKLFVSSNDDLKKSDKSVEGVSFNFNHINVKPIKSDHNEFQKSNVLYIPEKPIKVQSSSKQQTLIAESKGIEGQGRWHVLFGNNLAEGKQSISLTVPKGAIKESGKYQTSLTWNFTNAK